MKKSRRAIQTFLLALGLLLPLAPGALAAERFQDVKDINEIAKTASTPADHARVARTYLLHAKSLEAKADKLEREVGAERARPKNAMDQKWPALASGGRDRKERVAMQARRAAEESNRLAEHHSKLAGRTLEQIAALD